MFRLSDDERGVFALAVTAACSRAEVLAAVERVQDAVAADVAGMGAVCVGSGKCCRFEEYGHVLMVTTMDMAAFISRNGGVGGGPVGVGCPFQVGRMCGVHRHRPVGCRVFYCDPAAKGKQEAAYERAHGELKRWHGVLEVPYFYVEWREALAALAREWSR